MFGFNFVTKIVTLIDFSGLSASEDQPFGNLLPLMLLGDRKSGSSMKDMLPLMLLMGGNSSALGGLDMSNPLMLMALMGGSEGNDFFPMLMAMSLMGGKNPLVQQKPVVPPIPESEFLAETPEAIIQ